MIISRAPLRISLFGGSCDYPDYFQEHGAMLLGFAIDKYSYVLVRKTPNIFPFKTKVQYSEVEEVQNNRDIKHNGVRGVFEYLNDEAGYEISYLGDLPARTGIGSSSSFIVSLLAAIHVINGRHRSSGELAKESIEVERGVLNEPGGWQDQIWAAYGGFNRINLTQDGISVNKMWLDDEMKQQFFDRSILLYTGKTRNSFAIAESHKEVDALQHKHQIRDTAWEAYERLNEGDIRAVGRLLDKSWQAKRQIGSVSNPQIDSYYANAMRNGALGGKLLGAGGSGFLYFILNENVEREGFVKKMGLKEIPFGVDYEGVKVI